MKHKSSIYDLHGDHTEWLEKLFFYKDEVAIMQSRLEEVIKKNSSKESSMKVEHFQNQLIIQNSTIEMLKESIQKDELLVEKSADEGHYQPQSRTHKEEIRELEDFEKSFNSLRKELKEFLLQWM